MKKRLFCFFLCALMLLTFSGCKKDEKKLVKEWPSDAFDFMDGIPEFQGDQYTAEVDKDLEIVSVYYKEASLQEVYGYVEQLKSFGLEENISTPIENGKYNWMSRLKEGELFAEVIWYDREYELEEGSYSYSLVIKFAEF